jgi:hypothetical protein
MPVVTPVSWQQNVGAINSAQVMRLADSGAVKGSALLGANYIAGRGGVLRRGTGLNLELLQQGGGTMSINVEPGSCYVPGTESLMQGGYWVSFDSITSIGPFGTAHATLNRTDTVYVKVNDSFYSGVTNNAQILIQPGTPGGSAGSLAGINNVLMLGRVTIRAGATSVVTSDIQNNARWLTSPGGVTPTRSDETSEAGVYAGDLSIYANMIRYWDSTANLWRTMGMQSVSNLASIWNPTVDQLHWQSTNQKFHRWTGSAWQEWVYDIPRARLVKTDQQSIATSANTAIDFNEEDKDTLGGHSLVTNTSRYVCQRAGSYRVSGATSFAPNASGFRAVRIWKNGAPIRGNTVSIPQVATSANASIASRVVTVDLAVGDYVQLIALQNSGGALLTANGTDDMPTMEVEMVGIS